MFPQPRGRPPKHCVWNASRGGWDTNNGTVRPTNIAKNRTARTFTVVIAPPPPPANVPLRSPQLPIAAESQQPISSPPTQKQSTDEQDDKGKKHAMWCADSVPSGTPIYYIDAKDTLQELGKEQVAKDPPLRALPTRKRVRRVEVKVWGPDEERGLAEGEWEMEERQIVFYEPL